MYLKLICVLSGVVALGNCFSNSDNFKTDEDKRRYRECIKDNKTFVLIKEGIGVNLNCIQIRANQLTENEENSNITMNIEECINGISENARHNDQHQNKDNSSLVNLSISCTKEKFQLVSQQLNAFQLTWLFLDDDYEKCSLLYPNTEMNFQSVVGLKSGLVINLDCLFERILLYRAILDEGSIRSLLIVAEATFRVLKDIMEDFKSPYYRQYRECVEHAVNTTSVKNELIGETLVVYDECVVSSLSDFKMKEIKDRSYGLIIMRYIGIIPNILGVASNSLVLAILWKFREMRTPANIYVVSLSVALIYQELCDIVFDIMAIESFRHQEDFHKQTERELFLYRHIFIGFVLYIVPFSLAAMSLDRYISIKKSMIGPSVSSQRMRKRNALFCIIFTWILAACFQIGDVLFNLYRDISNQSALLYATYVLFDRIVVPFVVIISTSAMTSRLLQRAARNCPGENQIRQREARTKSARVIVGLTLNHFVSYFVLYVTDVASFFMIAGITRLNMDVLVALQYIGTTAGYVTIVNSILNPVVLYLCSPMWKNNTNAIICCCKNK